MKKPSHIRQPKNREVCVDVVLSIKREVPGFAHITGIATGDFNPDTPVNVRKFRELEQAFAALVAEMLT